MSARISGRLFVLSMLLVCLGFNAHAQATGSYTPYSIFGVGDLSNPGSAYHKTMGSTGIASRNNRYVNILNPASVTARDSLSFMVDVSVYSDNKIFRQGDMKSASNTFNINDLTMSFPLWHSTAMMLGIMPFSDTGFGYSSSYTDPGLIGHTGNINFEASGRGSVYKGFAAFGVNLWKRLSLGAQADYYFGRIDKAFNTKFSDASFNGVQSSVVTNLNGLSGKFGIQYEQPLNTNLTLGLGATYSTGAKLKGYIENSTFSSGSAASDTLYFRRDTIGSTVNASIPGEIGVGVILKYANVWSFEFDYTRSDWTNSNLAAIRGVGVNGNSFTPTLSQAYRAGFEITPNRNDIRYYMKRVTYRAGAYYMDEYYLLNGNRVASKGITFGLSFPLNQVYNGITVGLDMGERGSLAGELIRERYFNISIGLNIFDIWFQKSLFN